MNKTFKDCTNEGLVVRIKFACGCRLERKNDQVFLTLPLRPGPCTGERKRLLGNVKGTTLHIYRNGRDFLRVKGCYGINVHLLESAVVLGFDEVYCDTPVRGGRLPRIGQLLARSRFVYAQAGFETQVGFTINEIGPE
jgi:hypothetical protein